MCDILSESVSLMRHMKSSWSYRMKNVGCLMNKKAKPGEAYLPTDVEHIANIITHGILIGPSALGMLWMCSLATTGNQWISAVVYGLALIFLFSVSTTFHTLSYLGSFSTLKNVFHIGDRAVIYLFIASSYTPWLLLKEFCGWDRNVMCLVWTLAVVGIAYQYTFHEQYKWLETLFYLVIGICPASVALLMEESSGLYEVSLGGITYVIGVVFFKCDGIIPFAHAIWHCFVFVGTSFQFYAVCTYLLGDKTVST